MSKTIAFDLGGTRLKAGVVDPSTGDVERLTTEDIGAEFTAALSKLGELGKSLLDEDVSGAGLCVPGLVDEHGIVVSLPGKLDGIEGFNLPGFLEAELGVGSIVVNDAIAYGAGETAFGSGADFDRVVVVTIGTGVGVTVFDKGRPISVGPLGGGILGGQIPISERVEGFQDTSGRYDTIEALCRADRIVDFANEAGGSFSAVPQVYEAFGQGDEAANSGIETYRSHLTRALVGLAHAHAPDVIVLGGGPMTPDNPLVQGIEDRVNARLFGSYSTRISISALGDSAALAGLAKLRSHV